MTIKDDKDKEKKRVKKPGFSSSSGGKDPEGASKSPAPKIRSYDQNSRFATRSLRRRSLRRTIDLKQTNVFRILNGAGDGVPGIYVDRFGPFAVSYEPREKDRLRRLEVYRCLMEIWGIEGIYEKGPASRGFHPDRSPEDVPVLGAAAPKEYPVRENGMTLLVRLREGARPGVYPDQRENRLYLAPFMAGARMLNLFSYTGAFSVWAALKGAKETVSVDLSRRALDWSMRNFTANGIDPVPPHRHVKADAFDYLGLARRKGFLFDLVIIDPPSFATSRRGLFRARRDWPRLIEAALKVLASEGRLAISCNTHEISRREILAMTAAGIEGKRSRVVKPEAVLGLPPDYPVPPGALGMDTLKFIVTRPIARR